MRTNDEIREDIESKADSLKFAIEASVRSEQASDNHCKKLNEEIAALRAEVSFENTLSGQIKALTDIVEDKVRILLDELEQKTGIKLELTFKK